MDFAIYQIYAKRTAVYPHHLKVLYPALGLSDEAGEVNGKIKKVYRDNDGVFTPALKTEILKEIGDVLWYLAAICEDLELSLDKAAENNIEKLKSRAVRGKLHGSGDNR